jgi:hypothetical protein
MIYETFLKIHNLAETSHPSFALLLKDRLLDEECETVFRLIKWVGRGQKVDEEVLHQAKCLFLRYSLAPDRLKPDNSDQYWCLVNNPSHVPYKRIEEFEEF